MMKRAAVSLIFLVGCQFELPGIECPADYAPLPGAPAGHVYLKAPESGQWHELYSRCWLQSWSPSETYQSYLAVPNDATELMGLFVLAGQSLFWVGIDDQGTEGVFMSAEMSQTVVPGSATFLPWAAGEPTDNDDYQDVGLGHGHDDPRRGQLPLPPGRLRVQSRLTRRCLQTAPMRSGLGENQRKSLRRPD